MDLLAPKRKITEIIHSLRSTSMTSAELTGILGLTFYLRLLYFGQYIDADVGNLGYLAWRMAEGEVLLDLEGPGKPPLYFMLYSLFIRLFGPSVLGLKLFGAIFVLMAVLAIYWVARQAYGKQVGLLAALLFGVFSSGPMVEGGGVNLETVLHLPYILAIGLFLKASMSGRVRWYFLTGLCAALATLVKQVGGVLFFIFLCYGIHERWIKKGPFLLKQWFYPVRKPRHLWRGWRKKCSFLIDPVRKHLSNGVEGGVQSPALSNGVNRYLLLGGGALLPVIGMIAFYSFHGYTLNQLYDSMLGSNLQYIRRGYQYANSLKYFSSSLKFILPENGLLWFGTIFTSAYLGWRIWRNKEQPGDRILLWWAFWSFAVLCIVGTFFAHYFLQIIAPFSLLTAYGMVTAWKLTKSLSPLTRPVARGGVTLFLGIAIIVFIKTDYKYFFSYSPEEKTVYQYRALDGLFDVYGIYNIVQQDIAFHIQAYSDPTETIYVWGIAPQIYFLAQRRAATRYRNNYNMSQLVTGNGLKALMDYAPVMMGDLKQSHPVYIVQIFPLEYLQEFQTFVRDHYKVEMEINLNVPPYRIRLYRKSRDIEVIPDAR